MVMALCSQTPSCTSSRPNEIDPKNKLAEEPTAIRVPAEWKPQAGIWMQWPTMWEKQLRNDFVRIIDVIQDYEPLNIIVRNRYEEDDTKTFLQDNGLSLTNITWWIYEYDSAWLRDNGPIWVINDQGPMIQDWGFDGWGGFTRWYKLDEKAPQNIADLLNMQCENKNNYILERGNFESNGKDTIILNWDCQNDRNPDWTKEQTEALFKKSFGVSTIIWVYGYEEDDLTKGHIDGVCRFINENTVVVARYADQDDPNAWIYENATQLLSKTQGSMFFVLIPLAR